MKKAHEIICDIAKRQPTANAVLYKDANEQLHAVTYKELDEKSNRLANYLSKQGLTPGDIVCVCLPRGIDWIVSLLALWKAGLVYMPISWQYSQKRSANEQINNYERIKERYQSAKAKMLITYKAYGECFTNENIDLI